MCASWLRHLRAYGSDLGCYLEFELGSSFGISMGEPVGYTLKYSVFRVSWISTCQLLWHMRRLFCCNFTCHTGWLDYWNCRSILFWLITSTVINSMY